MSQPSKNLAVLRHSAAHLLAHAVIELYPDTLLTIGPATEDGFFYDFLPTKNFKEEDLERLEARMKEIVARNYPIEHREISKEEARKKFGNNPFKLELIAGISGDTVGLSVQGNFEDLCRGGHVAATGELAHAKLLTISGAYWRADRSKQALQRISGTAFFTADELAAYEKRQEELALYDHRRLGRQLDLFSFHDVGVGFPFFHPKGMQILNTMKEYMRSLHRAHGYVEVATPTMLSDELWKQSGHYAFYADKMYFSTIDERQYALKPMNCPGSLIIYKSRPRSYRELPLKLAEFGHVHRHELSGVLHGLMRVRAFTQDDAHIYCMPSQLTIEIATILEMIQKLAQRFELHNIRFCVSTKPEKAMGSDELWKIATDALMNALTSRDLVFTIQEGEGAFYGPKIEVHLEDSMGRNWQCGTIQVDFFQPENFDTTYVASTGKQERPVIIHQAIFGSLERFFAIILEHYKGALPVWLAPIQARIMTITDDQLPAAQELLALCRSHSIRIEVDESSNPLSAKIKDAQTEKVPLMLILGKREIAAQQVTIRKLDGTQETGIPWSELAKKIANY